MKPTIVILFVLILFLSQNCLAEKQGRLVSYELWQQTDKDELREKARKQRIPKALVNPKYDVKIYDVKYISYWHDGTEALSSGLYFVPQGVEKPLPQLVYHHGTQTKKGREKEIKREANLALGYAVDGYLTLMPDYHGLGHGDRFHIYQNYESLGQSAVDFLFAVRELNQILKVQANEQLFLTGYSEGGYGALGTNKLIQERYSEQFRVTATAANAGAYDMAGVQSQAIFKPYPRPQFLPYLLMGVNEVYPFAPDFYDLFVPPYDSLVRELFNWTYEIDEMTPFFPVIAKEMLKDSIIYRYWNDPDFIFHKAMADHTICCWKPENPVQLCHCKGDEIVYYENSVVTFKAMRQLGAKHITLRNPGSKYGHRSCGIFATMYSKLYFDSFRNGSKHGRKGSLKKRFYLALAKLKMPDIK